MLRRIALSNFKSHKETEIRPALVTAFIGPNNGGKSSIFHALQLMRQATKSEAPHNLVPPKLESRTTLRSASEATYGYPRRCLDVGGFEDVVRRGANSIGIELEGIFEDASGRSLDVQYSVSSIKNRLARTRGRVSVEGQKYGWDLTEPWEVRLPPLQVDQVELGFAGSRNLAQPISASESGGRTGLSQKAWDHAYSIQQAIVDGVPALLRSINSAYGIRGFEEVGYHLADMPEDFELQLLDDRALAMSSAFPYNRRFEDEVSDWLEGMLGIRLRFEHTTGKRVLIRTLKAEKAKRVRETLIVNEGLGTHQLIFIFLPIALTPNHGTVLIEEPEAHLYPRAQSSLANLLARTAVDQNKQMLLTTHSEHILLSLLAEVRHGRLGKDQLAIYDIRLDSDGNSVTQPVRFDEHGRVEGGLPGFFDHKAEQLLDLLQTAEAGGE